MVDPVFREAVLRRVIHELKVDARIAGIVLVGSGATGFRDEDSDIDLVVVVEQPDDLDATCTSWGRELSRRLSILHRYQTPYTTQNRMLALELERFLQLEMSFVSLAELSPRWDQGLVVFDREGSVQRRIDAALVEPPHHADQLWLLDAACHRVLECRKALHRGELWRAYLVLSELRALTFQLAGFTAVGNARQRFVDALPAEFLALMARTAVPVEPSQVWEALRLLTGTMLEAAASLYEREGAEFPRRFADELRQQVD